jgi:hypothetical protein
MAHLAPRDGNYLIILRLASPVSTGSTILGPLLR